MRKKRITLHLDISQEISNTIKEIESKTEGTKTQIVCDAIRFYSWAINESENGHKVGSYNIDNFYSVPLLPGIKQRNY